MKVLIADDDAVTRRTLVALLQHLGYDPVATCDGPEAWEAIQAGNAPSLLILDWMMPEPSGVEICRRLHLSPKRVYQYVIMLTARDSVEDLVEGMDAGANDYLRKPFDLRELRVRLRAGERALDLQNALRIRATTDELTGLLNRTGIFERIDRELALVARDSRELSVLVIDIDNFKIINDTHGHPVGDEVLKEISTRMRAQLRPYDDIGRHGGEEFAILLPGCNALDAMTVGERIRHAIGDVPVSASSGAVDVTVSIGTASAGAGRSDTANLIAGADRALYAAKKGGRNRVECAYS